MLQDFAGRIAVVTGGASGIGRAAARSLAARGATVALFDNAEATLNEAAAELAAIPLRVDISDRAATRDAVDRVEREHGPVSVLVTAAGVLDAPRPPERITEQAWRRVFQVNVEGTSIVCELIGARMAERRKGAIVTVASITALQPGPLVIYGPAKATVVALTRALAGAWGRFGVRVNAVAPGYVKTPALQQGLSLDFLNERRLVESTALGRLASAEEVASAIAFLASDAAGAITGIVLPVDSGALLAGDWTAYGGFPDAKD